jgi:membrane protein implicated in regulation of membrane protease activity
MDPGSIGFDSNEPQIQLYFLLGLVYAAVTPFLLPFILIFFGFAYIVYRHQVSKHILDAWYFNVIFLTIVSGHLVSHGAVLY